MNKNDEIFHEIYGAYYNAVWHILNKIADDYMEISQKDLNDIIFEYSNKLIANGVWGDTEKHIEDIMKGINEAYNFDIMFKHPEMPLSTMQKRWLKAVLSDRRIKLFGIEEPEWLADIEPLFMPEHFYYFDQDLDGDDYSDKNYIGNFRKILKAKKEKYKLKIKYVNNSGHINYYKCAIPLKLEYSPRNDRFRLFIKTEDNEKCRVLNVSQIRETELSEEKFDENSLVMDIETDTLIFILDNSAGKKALSRAMREFSDLKKETEPLENNQYKITLEYYTADEKEIVIRLMQYLPYIEVVEPESIRQSIKEKLRKQLCFGELK